MNRIPAKQSDCSPTIRQTDVGLAWAVRNSFVDYIQRMRGGRIWLGDGAAVTNTGEFYFPFERAESPERFRTILYFRGEVRFSAHMGMLSLDVRHPRIELKPDRGTISIEAEGEWISLCEIDPPEPASDGEVTTWVQARCSLTHDGAPMFGGSYQVHEEMAPLTMRVPSQSLPISSDAKNR